MKTWPSGQRPRAKLLMGRPARVLTAAWIIEHGQEPFFQSQVADRLSADFGEARTAVIAELDKLVQLEILQRVDDAHRVWYVVRPSPLWDVMRLAAVTFGILGSTALSDDAASAGPRPALPSH